ncbi:pyrroline-5-carboxylate reductase [bacterium]|nr:pyrroline-5-carboxylate reductase [bacterium]
MNKKIGFIGCGKMASAIIKGILVSKKSYEIKGSELNPDIAEAAQKRLEIPVLTDNKILTIDSDVIVLAVKPNCVVQVLEDIKNEITQDKLIVSIAAGISTEKIESILNIARVVRVMPNTPALVLEGMSGVCKGRYASDDDVSFVVGLLSSIGKCIEVKENQMDIVTAISGSGPAFFYKVIEDIARAGEKLGLDYDKALMLATQTALGSAKMVFDRGELTVQTLIDNVATKGGCTFVGITTMSEGNSDELFFDIINNTEQKANELCK